MKVKTASLLTIATLGLPFAAQAQLFKNCTDKVLTEWSFNTKTVNPDKVDPTLNVTQNPAGSPSKGVGFGAVGGSTTDFAACFPNFNPDGYVNFGIEAKVDGCINFGGLTFDYITEKIGGYKHGPDMLNVTIRDGVTNEILFQTNKFTSSTSSWKHFDINDTASYGGVAVYKNTGWENLVAGDRLKFSIGGWGGNTFETGLDLNNLKITGCNCVPEPTSVSMAGLAALTLVLRRRRQS